MKTDLKTTPIEVVENSYRDELRKRFPAVYFDRFILVDSVSSRLGIDDISYQTNQPVQELIETMALCCRGWLEIYDAEKLSSAMANQIGSFIRVFDRKKTLIVFPGKGSKTVKDLLPEDLLEGFTTAEIPIQRKVDPKSNAVLGVEILKKTQVRKALSDIRPSSILVLDDVIASGLTLTTLQESFPTRNAEWFGGALMMLSPLQNRRRGATASSIDGYESVITPVVYQGTTGIPPLNSLSALIGTSEKSKAVRNRYIQEYIGDKETFLEAIQQLQKLWGERS